MGLLALIMIPLGFALSWWLLRTMEAKSRAPGHGGNDTSDFSDSGIASSAARRPHPSTLGPMPSDSVPVRTVPLDTVPLDDEPSHVIAAVARRVGAGDSSPRRTDDLG